MNSFKSNFLKNIQLKNIENIYDDFKIDPAIPFEEQRLSFKEDIIQIVFINDYLVDVGWYPEFEPEGFFKINVIQNYNWFNPLFEKKCKDIEVLKKYLQEAIDICEEA